ncbi:hypothetical protein SAMN05421538_104176 [Paracoccus isoporae]|uniref:Glycosyl transferase n=1 Tax=Paracoccus isoporae TaxID=591205 RepID=A0A1G7AKX0_9RHOB|nr:glycosyl transferase [Paracoccus isoporae]SDE15432.1 hypothetical protein SAMN05421538_104176 [Paracoccus isoporae]
MKQIICIKWGTKYGPDYVNRFYGMVSRNITPPFRVICFTDDGAGLDPAIETRPLPDPDFVMPKNTPGKWPKSQLWGDLGDITGTVLFMDLDIIVTGNLDGFFEFGDPSDTITAKNPNTPLERMAQTSIYRMEVGRLAPMREKFLSDPQGYADKFRYEQRFVTRNAPGGVKFWPRGWVSHFRMHCIPPFPLNYLRPPRIPRGTKVVIFAGHLNPDDAVIGQWSKSDPVRSPGDHLKATFDGRRRESLSKHLRHFYLPATWIAEKWR